MPLIAVDLFCGAGGTTVGLKQAGIDVRVAVEIDYIASKTYHYNNPEIFLLNEDIKNVNGEMIVRHSNITDNDKLLLVACPPCQGFSSIGKGDINDPRNLLVLEYLRLIEEIKPHFILMENVSGILKGRGHSVFNSFINRLKKDYEIIYDVLNAADYGVPQVRKRLVLHGIRHDLVEENEIKVSLPNKTHSNSNDNLPNWNTVNTIMDLPPLLAGESYESDVIHNHLCSNLSDINLRRIEYIRAHGGNRKSLPDELVLNCHKGKTGHNDVYGILNREKPSVTITAGCMSYSKGRFGHPTQNRALSAREAARLQSFPDEYYFWGNKGALAKQIGNAVPVKLAAASGAYFLDIYHELVGE
ncbi:DNA cytosine methyltransferase [Veillonella caviae]|uniref:DNA cytosine methyltransferase n=1 Tax=Veillonella caviae TaxID=248316 RepID=UPI0023F7DEB1|nr:DNA cytosine methyltransferase [Veillonella caviae]